MYECRAKNGLNSSERKFFAARNTLKARCFKCALRAEDTLISLWMTRKDSKHDRQNSRREKKKEKNPGNEKNTWQVSFKEVRKTLARVKTVTS